MLKCIKLCREKLNDLNKDLYQGSWMSDSMVRYQFSPNLSVDTMQFESTPEGYPVCTNTLLLKCIGKRKGSRKKTK